MKFNTKMKLKFNILLLIFTCFANFLNAQTDSEKPRYLKKAVVLCPVDITQLYTKEGFLNGNRSTLDTTRMLEFKSINTVDKKNKKKTIRPQVIRIDTVFREAILISDGFAFDIIQTMGSFSVIKFWPINEGSGVGLIRSLNCKKRKKRKALEPLYDYTELDQLRIDGLIGTNKEEEKIENPNIYDLSKLYYLVSTKSLLNNSTEFNNKKGLWNIGLLVMPIKIRPFATEKGQFDFSDGFSVGTTFSWTVHHNWKTDFSHNLLLYAGISSYTADSTKLEEKRNDYKIATFSPAIGWMWEKNGIQLSILSGIDFPSGYLQQKWVYRNKPWVGLGVGFGLFKIDNKESSNYNKNKI